MVGSWRRRERESEWVAGKAEAASKKQQQVLTGRAQQIGHVLATFQFKEECIIGWGRSSTVYKALLGDGTAVVLKCAHVSPGLGLGTDHDKLLRTLVRVQHSNLASILGWDLWRKVIVQRYMPNSCLARRLHSRDHHMMMLDWERRHRIALGVARGLEHLHHHCSPAIVHGNLKPTKILLDSDMEPCVTDFGMADECVETAYAAPEIALASARPTAKQDVFSFGVLLLELLTRQPPSSCMFQNGLTISAWVDKALASSSSSWQRVVDHHRVAAASQGDLAEIKAMLKLGVWCSHKLPAARPDMTTVVNIILQIRQAPTVVRTMSAQQHSQCMNATIRSLMLRRMQSTSARVFV